LHRPGAGRAGLVEPLSELPRTGAPDEVCAAAGAGLSPEESAALTFAIVAINGWDRLAVGLRPGVLGLDGPGLPDGASTPGSA